MFQSAFSFGPHNLSDNVATANGHVPYVDTYAECGIPVVNDSCADSVAPTINDCAIYTSATSQVPAPPLSSTSPLTGRVPAVFNPYLATAAPSGYSHFPGLPAQQLPKQSGHSISCLPHLWILAGCTHGCSSCSDSPWRQQCLRLPLSQLLHLTLLAVPAPLAPPISSLTPLMASALLPTFPVTISSPVPPLCFSSSPPLAPLVGRDLTPSTHARSSHGSASPSYLSADLSCPIAVRCAILRTWAHILV